MTEQPAFPPMSPIRVDRDGHWAWEGQPMVHDGILVYLKQHLERDPEGQYWIAVGPSRVPVIVEDAPFVVETLASNPARLVLDDTSEEPVGALLALASTADNRLYARVKGGRDRALLSRKAHHQIWDALQEDAAGRLWLELGGQRLSVSLDPL